MPNPTLWTIHFRGLKGKQEEDSQDDPFLVVHPNYAFDA
jgi:hypothetical protein